MPVPPARARLIAGLIAAVVLALVAPAAAAAFEVRDRDARTVRGAVEDRSGRAVSRGPALLAGFAVPDRGEVRRADLFVKARRGGRRLRAWQAVRAGGSLVAAGPRGGVRGKVVRRTGRSLKVRFRVTARVRPGARVRFLVAPRGRRGWRRAAWRPRLRVKVAAGAPAPGPAPGPSPGPAPGPSPSPSPGPAPGPSPSPAPSPPPADGTTRILAAGDIACDPADASFNGGQGTSTACRQMATAAQLTAQPVEAVLALGDLQYQSPELSHFMASYDPSWGRVKTLTRPVPGNHEYEVAGAAGYYDYFNGSGVFGGRAGDRDEGYYSFDAGEWHVVALNSNCWVVACSAGSAQEQWLRADLAAHPAACTLAFMHHPRLTGSQSAAHAPVRPLWDALHQAGADLVLAGHAHNYERFAPMAPDTTADPATGLRQIVVGTGGKGFHPRIATHPTSEVFDNSSFGVLELDLAPTGYGWRFLPVDGGPARDAGSAGCHGAP